MILSEPGQTDYDINFSLLGFPIRIHPGFFIAPLVFGSSLAEVADNVGIGLVIVALIFFVSILLHELGHSLAFKYYGLDSKIVLHWMGGLAIPEQNRSWGGHRSSGGLTHNAEMIVSFAGPLMNVLQAAAMLVIGWAIGGQVEMNGRLIIPMPVVYFPETIFNGNNEFFLLFYGFVVLNLLWALLNLMPVYPLDGGQIARAFMSKLDPRDGARNSVYLSLAVAALLVVYALMTENTFMAIFFGFMAFSNWQMLQAFQGPRW